MAGWGGMKATDLNNIHVFLNCHALCLTSYSHSHTNDCLQIIDANSAFISPLVDLGPNTKRRSSLAYTFTARVEAWRTSAAESELGASAVDLSAARSMFSSLSNV